MCESKQIEKILISFIERCLYEVGNKITHNIIIAGSKGNKEIAEVCLKKWEAEGICDILKPLEEASGDEVVAAFHTYITKSIPALPDYTPEQFEKILKARINRHNSRILNRKFILNNLGQCMESAKICLEKWENEGKCEILKPLEEAEDEDDVVKMKPSLFGH